MKRSTPLLLLLCVLGGLIQVFPQSTSSSTSDRLPLKPDKELRFKTEEGTWLSLDVSPDGKTIVFDMLGDLFTLPIRGGRATPLTSGMALDAQPRYSPDGKRIVFLSDRDGETNIWVINSDGSSPVQLTNTETRNISYVSPEWSPDGNSIVVSRGEKGAVNPGFVVYEINVDSRVGKPLSTSVKGDYLGSAFGSDPRFVFAALRRPFVDWDQIDSFWQLVRLDRTDNSLRFETAARMGQVGFRPILSPDSRYLVYGAPNGSQTGLRLRDLTNDRERWLVPSAQRDVAWWYLNAYSRDLLPGSAFTPDGKSLITSYGGKIWSVAVPSGATTPVPFMVDVKLAIGPVLHREFAFDDSKVDIRAILHPNLSPDGKQLAFSAVDRVWVMELPSGKPRRLTSSNVGEFFPVWSPDGQSITYCTWDDTEGGGIYRMSVNVGSAPRRLTSDDLYYASVRYSPDGKRLAAIRGQKWVHQIGDADAFRLSEKNKKLALELVTLPSEGGKPTVLGPVDAVNTTFEYLHGQPHFAGSDGEIFVNEFRSGLVAITPNGERRRVLTVSGYTRGPLEKPLSAYDVVLSPDKSRALIRMAGSEAFLIKFAAGHPNGESFSVYDEKLPPGVEVQRITQSGADFLGWSTPGNVPYFSVGNAVFIGQTTASGVQFQRVDINLQLPAERPSGTIVLRGARIITMRGDEVIERGDVLVKDNRIVAVGSQGSVAVPPGVTVIDVTGKTIVPGFLDIHYHVRPPDNIHPTQQWNLQTHLAYGVTTIRDPHNNSMDLLSYGERERLGQLDSPRVFTTLLPLYHFQSARDIEAVRANVRRYAEFYRTEHIKNKQRAGRRSQQFMAIAAREQGVVVDNEGDHDPALQLTFILDGLTAIEHSTPGFPLYHDVLQLIVQSGTYQTFTLGTSGGFSFFARRFDRHSFPANMRKFYPEGILDRKLDSQKHYDFDEVFLREFAEQPARIVAAGGHVGMGSHGDIPGIGVHWEMWLHSMGGMKNHDILRAATLWSAEAIGHRKDLGSVEPGKLADLVILDANPLVDIHNTIKLQWVMKNGTLYEPFTLERVGVGVKQSKH
jgi:dipeptidyl aminopeptidase/acylaminoacyl peptidase